MFVLDTNTVVYFFKGMGHVAEHLLSTPPNEVALPAIVLHELETGIAKSSSPRKRRRQLGELTSWMRILSFGAEEARTSARIRAVLETAGTPIGPLDTLIAGTAVHHHGHAGDSQRR